MKNLEVNLSYLSHNLSTIRSLIPENCHVCATVKADAYGHGLLPVAKELVKTGIDFLGLTEIADARILREKEIKTPIFLYMPVEEKLEEIIELNLIPFVSSLKYLQALEKVAQKAKTRVKVHVKVDVGMGRFGCLPEDSPELVGFTLKSPYLDFHGFCSHFSESEEYESRETTLLQLERFELLRKNLEKEGKLPPFVHIANSQGLINFPQSRYNLVRPGAMLYGYSDSPLAPQLLQTMRVTSEVILIKKVPANTSVSYNSLYKTKEAVWLCVVPMGYCDGLDMHLMQKGATVYLNGSYYPIVGKICMNAFLVEVPLQDCVGEGDTVELVSENQSMIVFGSFYPSGSYYDAMCRLGCGQKKSYK